MMTMTSPRQFPITLVFLLAASAVLSIYMLNSPFEVSGPDDALTPESSGLTSIEQVQQAITTAVQRREVLLQPDTAISNDDLASEWGVEVTSLSISAAGHMLDFRFRVVDVEKALPLFDGRIKPSVISEGNNIEMPVPMFPKIGMLRTTNRGKNIKAGKIYTIMFANTGRYIKPGEKVSVVIGDFKVEHLTVR